MRKTSIVSAALVLGTISFAHAQEQKKPELGGAGPAMERGSGPSVGGDGPPKAERQAAPKERAPAEQKAAKEGKERAARSQDKSEENGARQRQSKSDDGKKEAQRATRDEGSKEGKDADKASRSANKTDSDTGEKSEKADNKAEGRNATTEKSADSDSARKTDTKAASTDEAKNVKLSNENKGRLRESFRDQKDVKPRKGVDISINVGRRLPRDWHYYPVPVAVIGIVPQYRDYVFVYVDDEYVICDPATYEVVAVIPADGPHYARGDSGSDRCPTQLRLSRDEREMILDNVRTGRVVDVGNLEIGWSVPADIELQRFPQSVIERTDELNACRYFVARGQLAIVDPLGEKVVLVIDKG